jgi:hypothetical protein
MVKRWVAIANRLLLDIQESVTIIVTDCKDVNLTGEGCLESAAGFSISSKNSLTFAFYSNLAVR